MLNMGEVGDLLRYAVGIALRVGGPMLLMGMLVGVVVAVFQAVTQIHEQTISFMLKLVIIISVLLIGGGWMLTNLQDFTFNVFDLMVE